MIGASPPPIGQTTTRYSVSPAAGQAATGARPRSTPIDAPLAVRVAPFDRQGHVALGSRRDKRKAARRRGGQRKNMRAGACERRFACERQRAVILFLEQGQAKLDAAFGRILALGAVFIARRFFRLIAGFFLAIRMGVRLRAKLFEFETIGAGGQTTRKRDVPIVGARLQALDHIALRVFQARRSLRCRQSSKDRRRCPCASEKSTRRRQIDDARRVRLQLLRVERDIIIEAVVMGEAARFDAIVASRKLGLERPVRRDLADAFLLAFENLADHAFADRRDRSRRRQKARNATRRARAARPRLRFAPLQPLRLVEGQGVRPVAFERLRGNDGRQPRDHARFDILWA